MKYHFISLLFFIWSSNLADLSETVYQPTPRGRIPIGVLNQKKKVYTFDLYPKEIANLKTTYNSTFWEYTHVYEGQNLIYTLKGKDGRSDSGRLINKTASIITYRIDNGNSGGHPQSTTVRILEEKPGYAKIGWEDGEDTDYDDAVLQISIAPPPPNDFPQPRGPRGPHGEPPMPDGNKKIADSTKKSNHP